MSKKNKKNSPALKTIGIGIWRKVGWGLAWLLGLTGTASLVTAAGSLSAHRIYLLTMGGLIVLGCGVGIMAAMGDWLKFSPPKPIGSDPLFLGLAGLAGLAIFLLIQSFGMCQFGGFDHSVVIDVAWRLVQGQKPYVDFPCTLPPGFFLGAKYAFQWFGVKWQSLILMNGIFSLITYVWSLWLLVKIFPGRYLALLFAVTIQAVSLLLVSFWWYNPITSSATALFLLAATFLWHRPESKAARFSYFSTLFLVVLMKPNVVGLIVPLVTLVFMASHRHRRQIMALSALALVVFVLFLKLNDLTLPNLIKGYLAVAHRGFSLGQFLQGLSPVEKKLSISAWILALLPAAVSMVAGGARLLSRCPWLGLAGIVGGCNGFLTNGELKLVDLPPIFIGSFLVVASLNRNREVPAGAILELSSGWRRYAAFVCIVFCFSGLAEGITRQRVKGIGYETFFQYELAQNSFPDGFFEGLRSGGIFHEVNQQIAGVLGKEPNSTVVFGPRMQWAYAAFHKPSPQNEPIWWHPGVAFAAADEGLYIDRFFAAHHDLVILDKNDTTYYSPDYLQGLLQNYDEDQSYSRITVLRRKQTAARP
jgi:hypothetical protein